MTIYVVEDHPLMRTMLVMLLRRINPAFTVQAVANIKSLSVALRKCDQPKLICLDLGLPDADANEISAVHVTRELCPDTPLAVITAADADLYRDRCLQAGASVFIEKKQNSNIILYLLKNLVNFDGECSGEGFLDKNLTRRQKQLVIMLDMGLTNNEIAKETGVNVGTVKAQIGRLYRLFGVNSRVEAIHFSRVHGLL